MAWLQASNDTAKLLVTRTEPTMRILIIAFLTVLAAPAGAAGNVSAMEVGNWAYDCNEGKLVGIYVSLLIAGEITVQIPPDVCTQAFQDRMAAGLRPLAVIKPLANQPAASSSAPARGEKGL
jgi:hypothetical protein